MWCKVPIARGNLGCLGVGLGGSGMPARDTQALFATPWSQQELSLTDAGLTEHQKHSPLEGGSH